MRVISTIPWVEEVKEVKEVKEVIEVNDKVNRGYLTGGHLQPHRLVRVDQLDQVLEEKVGVRHRSWQTRGGRHL